ncbi:ABC transporter permease [Polymorphum gilvum]|uniref:Putative amino acid or sugar ABC transport system, permease protein n=1 Tax=Polymorphum gilvum (strain LMG 25793 / CGMCC 1.9160 / SL003B-26A1) TaxID=991905 RepID=F2J2T7_POLGS|nr:ABC transporter permease [Polymorphum gilvum]ADZ72111.1 Putative amino acid or sugar ABC transport system, permease protein [Polymorphum gilvum SL003B-26A1]
MSAGQLPRWVDFGLIPLLNLAAAFLVSGLVVLLIGESPLEAVGILVWGSLGFGEGIGFTLFYATNFIFTGLAVAVAFHAGLFNIGGEGQAYIGGLGVAWACLALDRIVPWWVTMPVAVLGAAAAGAAWAFVPAWLQARRGSHVVITTIMFNFIAASLMVYLLVNVMAKPGSMQPETRTFEAGGRLPMLNDLLPFASFGTAPVNLALVLALVAALAVWVLVWRTRLGYAIRTLGANPTAAVYAGISPARTIVVAMLISGGLAGMMAINEIMGSQHRLLIEFVSGYGFVGIAVALMGRAHPLGIVLAAILFGMLYQGGAELSFEKPAITRDMIVVIQGLVILFAGALEHMFRPTLVRIFTFARAPSATVG